MPLANTLLYHPRRLWIRRALFQVHLWVGVLLSAYVVVIALSGAVLVFENELTATTLPAGMSRLDPKHMASLPEVVARFHRAFPAAESSMITVPTPSIPAYQIAASERGVSFPVISDPTTGVPHRIGRTWVAWVHDLHLYLLLPHRYGLQVNAVGAGGLSILCITGLAVWWQGLRFWTRGLTINMRARWRRVNYDAHSAIGFWTLALVLWWAFSGFYFGFYKQVAAAINLVSPVRAMVAPVPMAAGSGRGRVSLEALLASAQAASPQGHLYALSDPLLAGTSVYASMDRAKPADFSHRDIVVLDATSGRVLSVWHYGQNQTLGDWILWAMHPLHFGTLWGLPIKIAWCLFGVSLAVLSVSGVLMYWNRFLRPRWHALR